MKQELLYARVNLSNVPQGKKVQLIGNKLLYKEKKKEITLHQLDIPTENNFNFMNLKISENEHRDWFQIIWDIDTVKFEQFSKKPYEMPNRKLFYSFMRHCYIEQNYDFLSRSTLNIIEELGRNRSVYCEEWVKKREQGDKYYALEKNIIRIGKSYIDTHHGCITHSKVEVSIIKGGIVVDSSNQEWISDLSNSFQETTKTLVVCSQNMIFLWNTILTDKEQKVLTIANKKDLSSISYQELSESHFVLISTSFLTHKSYSNCWDNYLIDGNLKLKEVFQTMSNEVSKDPQFLEHKTPVLSLIEWNRLILDCDASKRLINDQYFAELISTFKAPIRWLHLKQISMMNSDIITYMRFLINDDKIHFPLYNSDGKIEPVANLVWRFEQKSKIQKNCENVKSQPFESEVDRFFVVQNSYNPLKVETVINGIIRNSRPKQEIATIISKKEEELEIIDPCPICQEEFHTTNALFTKCGHSYCIQCAIKSCYLQGKCALCRTAIKFDDLYKIKSNQQEIVGSRYQKMLELILAIQSPLEVSKDVKKESSEGKIIVVFHDKEMLEYINNLLASLKIPSTCCQGSQAQKKKQIDQFNLTAGNNILLVRSVDIDWVKSTRNIKRIIFLDTPSDMSNLMSLSFDTPMEYYFIIRQSTT